MFVNIDSNFIKCCGNFVTSPCPCHAEFGPVQGDQTSDPESDQPARSQAERVNRAMVERIEYEEERAGKTNSASMNRVEMVRLSTT